MKNLRRRRIEICQGKVHSSKVMANYEDLANISVLALIEFSDGDFLSLGLGSLLGKNVGPEITMNIQRINCHQGATF